MDIFSYIIDVLIYSALFIGVIKAYLTLNKLWVRRTNPDVADSISIYGNILGLISTLPFFIKYVLIDADYESAVRTLVSLLIIIFCLLLGSGYWIHKRRTKQSLFSKFKRALKLENKESGTLLMSMFMPTGAEKILSILHKIALIDNQLDNKEIEFIQRFAKNWNLDYDFNKINEKEVSLTNYITIKDEIQEYLELSPPKEQVAELSDIISSLVEADNEICDNEKLLLPEIQGMIESFVNETGDNTKYEVIIAPQNSEHREMLLDMLPNSLEWNKKAGVGYIVGDYYSSDFARMVCKRYRALNLFATVEILGD